MLDLVNVNSYYGNIHVLKDVNLSVKEGQIVCLLGANGAGKTTTVRTIVGLNRSADNDIRFRGQPLAKVAPHRIVRLGIAMVPERREIFPGMNVADNLDMGAYTRAGGAEVRTDRDRVYRLFELTPGEIRLLQREVEH